MTVFLVRHGRTEANANGELLGRRDPVLDAHGLLQATATGAELLRRLGDAPTVVISSPLRRTMATAEMIAATLIGAGPVEVDDRWIELDYGAFEGTPVADVPPDVWARWRRDPTFAPDGGERLADLRARVAPALADAVSRASGGSVEHVVVVSHVSPIKAAVADVLGVGDDVTWRLFLAPASITSLAMRGAGSAVLASFNETTHRPD